MDVPLMLFAVLASLQSGPLEFDITCPGSAYAGKAKVSAVVYLSKRAKVPMQGPDWFNPEPCYSGHFNAAAGEVLHVKDRIAIGFPGRLSQLAPGEYTVQAVVDRNLGGRSIASTVGNFYSAPVQLKLDPGTSGRVAITCDKPVLEPELTDKARIRFVKFRSEKLSSFYGRPAYLRAAVMLPIDYGTDQSKVYPVIYEVPGFGGSVSQFQGYEPPPSVTNKAGQSFVNVSLDPDCPTGHSVFADSDNNGPWGTSLVEELIPYLEKNYRLDARPGARFVRGHSSGGWSSLWLQVSHPSFFGGVWSTSPDPVDFTDFQMIDIYKPGENMFKDATGIKRPLARDGTKVLAYYQNFSDMERPIRGEQLGSFEGVFSPRGKDGEPKKLWNRETGAIDPSVAEAWKRFDIDLILRQNWNVLGPKLSGKLHVYCGSEDTFYLDGAVRKLKKTLANLGSDAKVELFPGNHFTVMTPSLRQRINEEMAKSYRTFADK